MRDPSATATERVGRYQLLEPVGTGPCGSVSRAKVFGVAGFERQFALKRFSAEITSVPATAQALSTAARQYGGLEHPRIARMAEFGVAQGQTYTAVELVVGLDVMRLVAEVQLAGGTLAAGGGLALISQAARAVGYAHGRGLSHLGLSPTNLIVTSDGDVKVTDFGILAATMPPKPVDSPRLANRIAYLAPEQLAGEAVSAASDVFVLGVIAYELVTGHRAFAGDSPQQIARAILGGPPQDPALPRPIVRVLQRCLARSPFERFPDARALADALDAALRVAPVPGTRKDIGAQVKLVLDRLAALNEGAMSGVVALHVGTAPRPPDPVEVRTLGREIPDQGPTSEYRKPDMNVPLPPGYDSPAITQPELPRPMTTVPGLAPPPIPVPPGISVPPGASPPRPPVPGSPGTMLGMPAVKKASVPAIPPIKPRAQTAGGDVPAPVLDSPSHAYEVPTRVATEVPLIAHAMRQKQSDEELILAIEAEEDSQAHEHQTVVGDQGVLQDLAIGESGPLRPEAGARTSTLRDETDGGAETPRGATLSGHEPARPTPRPGTEERRETAEIPPLTASALGEASMRPTSEIDPAMMHAWREDAPHATTPQPSPSAPPMPPQMQQHHVPQHAPDPGAPPVLVRVPRRSRRWPVAVLAFFTLGALGAVGWQLWLRHKGDEANAGTAVAANGKSGSGSGNGNGNGVGSGSGNGVGNGSGNGVGNGSGNGVGDGSAVATGSAVAGSAVENASGVGSGTDTGSATGSATVPVPASGSGSGSPRQNPTPSAPSDLLQIASTPAGARVFIDGAEQGATPVKLPGSADRHTVTLLAPGHELYTAEVDGHGTFNIKLTPVTPTGGPAGIKVIKCKAKNRYYVYVDSKPTGMTCPTERIETTVGPHTVEVYDIVTETPRKFEINVADTRLSYRVRIE